MGLVTRLAVTVPKVKHYLLVCNISVMHEMTSCIATEVGVKWGRRRRREEQQTVVNSNCTHRVSDEARDTLRNLF